jgi:hypothetical protein
MTTWCFLFTLIVPGTVCAKAMEINVTVASLLGVGRVFKIEASIEEWAALQSTRQSRDRQSNGQGGSPANSGISNK